MDITDLVEIGQLGKLESDGFYRVQIDPQYESNLNRLQECFLIFNSHRVFFVTVSELIRRGKASFMRFEESGVAEESIKHPNATLALHKDDIDSGEDDSDRIECYNYTAFYNGVAIGSVSGMIENPLHSVLIIDLEDGRELLVPFAETYVNRKDTNGKVLELQNIEQLLEICTSKS